MIREVTCYTAVCDVCGKENNWVWGNPDKALDVALTMDEWHVIDGRLYCPDCYEYDEETDGYKPKVKD